HSTTVAAAAARPPSSAPGCRSGVESNRSRLQAYVPASFMVPGRKTQGRSGGNLDFIEHLFGSQEVVLPSLYVYLALLWRPGSSRPRSQPGVALAAGFIPAATMSLKPPSVAPSGFRKSKPSVALAAGFIPAATMSLKPPSVASSGSQKNPNRIPEREQARREATGR